MTELVGHTPLPELRCWGEANGWKVRILAKLEYGNPAGSVKDRVALAMVEDAVRPGAVIMETHQRHTGIGLAAVAACRGYGFV